MSKTLHKIALPAVGTVGNISAYKEVLETIGFTVDLTTNTAAWGDTGINLVYNSNGFFMSYDTGGYGNGKVAPSPSASATNYEIRYVRYGTGLAFTITTNTNTEDYFGAVILPDNGSTGRSICLISETRYILLKTQNGGEYKYWPNTVYQNGEYTKWSMSFAPFYDWAGFRDDCYLGLYFPATTITGNTRKFYQVVVGNKTYLVTRLYSGYVSPIVLDMDLVWDDADY